MSIFDTLDDIKHHFYRFLIPVILLIFGIVLMQIGMTPKELELNNGETLIIEQEPWFLYASLFFILGSVVWILYLTGIIRTAVGYIIMGIMGILAVYILYIDFTTIKGDVDYKNRWEQMDADIKARMLDIKEAQLAYKEFHGTYTNSFDDLIEFVKNGKKMKIKKVGSIPERKITVEERDYLYDDDRPIDKLMTEEEAYRLSRSPLAADDLKDFVRDTNYVPVLNAIFYDSLYVDNRNKMDAEIDFHPDSLRYIPYTKDIVTMDTSSVLKSEINVPTLKIEMTHPLTPKKNIYTIGELTDNHLRESWKD